jgi:membrane protease YdiL (CAAX protease family)
VSSPDAGPPAIAEALGVYAGVALGAGLLTLLGRAMPQVADLTSVGVAALFFAPAYALGRRRGLERYGIALGGVLEPPDPEDPRPAGPLGLFDLARAVGRALRPGLKEVGVALLVAAVVFPPFIAGFGAWHGLSGPPAFHPPPAFGLFLVTQLVVVALPEEAFFRGYLQTRLAEGLPGRGGRALAWVAQAALFAAVHVITIPHPARLAVFFPGLLFGALRAWRGGIGAGMVVHAMSNGLAELLSRGWS